LERLLKIVLLRGEGWLWKEIGQAARKLHDRELSNLPEALAKGIAARLEQKPPPIGEAKARNEALVEKIRELNRRAPEAKATTDRRAKRQRPTKSAK
jgi:hypothetical protein